MKVTDLVIPMIIVIACVIALLIMNIQGIGGGEWDTIAEWFILVIPTLFGILLGLYYLMHRKR